MRFWAQDAWARMRGLYAHHDLTLVEMLVVSGAVWTPEAPSRPSRDLRGAFVRVAALLLAAVIGAAMGYAFLVLLLSNAGY